MEPWLNEGDAADCLRNLELHLHRLAPLEQRRTTLERIRAMAEGLRSLDRLGAAPPTPLTDAVRTLRDVSLVHRLLAQHARAAPLKIAFTVEDVPGVWVARFQRNDARLRVIPRALDWLAQRNVVELQVAAPKDAKEAYGSVVEGISESRLLIHPPSPALTRNSPLLVVELAAALPALHTLSFAPLPAGPIAVGARQCLELELLPPRVRHVTLYGACASRNDLQKSSNRLATLTLRSTEQRLDMEVDLGAVLQAADEIKVKLSASGCLLLTPAAVPPAEVPPAEVPPAANGGISAPEQPGAVLAADTAGETAAPAGDGAQVARPFVLRQVAQHVLRQFDTSGAARLEMNANRLEFAVKGVSGPLCECSTMEMEAAMQPLTAQHGAEVVEGGDVSAVVLVRCAAKRQGRGPARSATTQPHARAARGGGLGGKLVVGLVAISGLAFAVRGAQCSLWRSDSRVPQQHKRSSGSARR
eukprot:scaffold8.g1638.t1